MDHPARGGGICGKGLWRLGEFSLFQEISHSSSDRTGVHRLVRAIWERHYSAHGSASSADDGRRHPGHLCTPTAVARTFLAPLKVVSILRKWRSGRPYTRTTFGPIRPFEPKTDGAIPHSERGLDTFGEANFSGLSVGHLGYLRSNSVSRQSCRSTKYHLP